MISGYRVWTVFTFHFLSLLEITLGKKLNYKELKSRKVASLLCFFQGPKIRFLIVRKVSLIDLKNDSHTNTYLGFLIHLMPEEKQELRKLMDITLWSRLEGFQ